MKHTPIRIIIISLTILAISIIAIKQLPENEDVDSGDTMNTTLNNIETAIKLAAEKGPLKLGLYTGTKWLINKTDKIPVLPEDTLLQIEIYSQKKTRCYHIRIFTTNWDYNEKMDQPNVVIELPVSPRNKEKLGGPIIHLTDCIT